VFFLALAMFQTREAEMMAVQMSATTTMKIRSSERKVRIFMSPAILACGLERERNYDTRYYT
jgi:hypothetical protein